MCQMIPGSIAATQMRSTGDPACLLSGSSSSIGTDGTEHEGENRGAPADDDGEEGEVHLSSPRVFAVLLLQQLTRRKNFERSKHL